MIQISPDADCLKGKGCKYFKGVYQPYNTETKEKYICEAYEDGIPDEILSGEINHDESFKNDDNITYEEYEG